MPLTDVFILSAVVEPNTTPRKKRLPPLSLRLSVDERTRLMNEAAGAPLGAYIKTKLLGSAVPVRMRRTGLAIEDRTALAQVLALLGRSRLSSNPNQLAFSQYRRVASDAGNGGRTFRRPGRCPRHSHLSYDRPRPQGGGCVMILKASQRGGGQDLAAHFMRTDDNEHVSLHELRGFAADDLRRAFKRAEAVSRGTKCQQYLLSLSLSPPENDRVPVDVFEDTIDRIERRLGLDGQPRAVVLHEKEGRRHAHCVWSRIDADTMTARPMSFFETKLMAVSRELYLEHGWTVPRGLDNAADRNPTNFSLAEWQQAKRQGVDPRWIKQALQDCWNRSDNLNAFRQSLQDRGFFLARVDKRGFVVLDHGGEVYSLPRMLDVKTKEVRARLGDGQTLSSVEDTQKTIGQRMTPAIRRHVQESRDQFRARSGRLGEQKEQMTRQHRAARVDLDERQKAEWMAETVERAARLPKGLLGIWHRITGQYREVRSRNETDAAHTLNRHAAERQTLIDKQLEQRAGLQMQFKTLRKEQAERLLDLRADIGRDLKFTRGSNTPSRTRDMSIHLKIER